MSSETDYHEIVVSDEMWAQAEAIAKRRRWAPHRRVLSPRHSSGGTKEEVVVGELALKKWAREHGVKLNKAIGRVTDYGDLKVRPGHKPSHRHACLIRAAKNPGYDTVWRFTGWRWGHEAPGLVELDEDLPEPAYAIPPEMQKTPDQLIEELRSDGR
jgi:hypothetical protein